VLLRRSGSTTVEEITNDHLPLGIDAGEQFTSAEAALLPGDTLLILTDGLLEVQSAAGVQLGFEALKRTFAATQESSLEVIGRALLSTARTHGTPLDDQSILLLRRSPLP